jgi:hypothetical protein
VLVSRRGGGLVLRGLFVAIAALALCGPAHAADWRLLFTTGDGDRWEYDAGTVRKAWDAGGAAYPKMWVRVNFAEPVGTATKAVYQVMLGCRDQTVQMLYEARYDDEGDVVWSGSGGGTTPIIPGSVGEDLHTALCDIAK